MTNECSIVKDLLPLYAENLTGEETNEFVKTHLEECESCRSEYAKIKEPPAAQDGTAAEAAPLKACWRLCFSSPAPYTRSTTTGAIPRYIRTTRSPRRRTPWKRSSERTA